MSPSKRTIALVGNTGFSLYHFRRHLVRGLLERGHSLVAIFQDEGGFAERFREMGVTPHCIRIDHKGMNPVADAHMAWTLWRLYRRLRPDVAHHFTIKPVLYGSMAAKLARVPVVANTITGLGYAFEQDNALQKVVRVLYRLALHGPPRVIFQNRDDMRLFVQRGLARPDQSRVILGSGVDTLALSPAPRPHARRRVIFIGRMLWSKGVREFVEAAQSVKLSHPEVKFTMVGGYSGGGSASNPQAVPRQWIDQAVASGAVEWLGAMEHDQLMDLLDACDVCVLPSYREGLPMTLIEAAAKGKALIAADVPGCREAVRHGENGFLVPPRNAKALTDCLRGLLDDSGLVAAMGSASRRLAVETFDARAIIEQTLAVYGLRKS